MSLFGGITDTLFGSGSDGQEKANKRSYEYTKEMADQSRNDAIALYVASSDPLRQGYQGAIDALGGATREQITNSSQGNFYAQQALLAGMPQFQNAILGNTVDNSAIQAKLLRPNQRMGWMYDQQVGQRSGTHAPMEGRSQGEIDALRILAEAGLSPQQIRELAFGQMLNRDEANG